jgi:hypothetical protein
MDLSLKKFNPILHLFLVLAVIILFSFSLFSYQQIKELKDQVQRKESISTERQLATQQMPTGIQAEDVKTIVSDIVATLSARPQTKTVVKERVVTEESHGTTYIPLGTTATTTSTDWVTVEDSATYIDLINDYGKNATVSWQASLKVAHGNGQAFARLYDDTNKIAVNGSEISTTNNASFEQVSSGNLPFWRGRNLYKVQIKSLNSFEVTYSGGKIKVSY